MRVVSLHIYPVKGMRAVDVGRARVTPIGFERDRRWLVVEPNGIFITQRSHPRLATVTALAEDGGLTLLADGMPPLHVAAPDGSDRMRVVVWESTIDAARASVEAAQWLSEYMGAPLALVHMDARSQRAKDSVWVPAPVPVSFADAYPVLVATTGSLAALNDDIMRHGGEAVPMRRFRPNIVIDCDDAWQDDTWKAVRIGGAELDLVKPCERCIVTTRDQLSGESMGDEPLTALRRLRTSSDPRISGVLFAWNAVPTSIGSIAVGDDVKVLEYREQSSYTTRDVSIVRPTPA